MTSLNISRTFREYCDSKEQYAPIVWLGYELTFGMSCLTWYVTLGTS